MTAQLNLDSDAVPYGNAHNEPIHPVSSPQIKELRAASLHLFQAAAGPNAKFGLAVRATSPGVA